MIPLQALILGIIQGATEFFPVSSSAHLRLCKHFLGISDGEHLIYFDLLCHAGTLLALCIFLRKEILAVLKKWKKITPFLLALLPLVPAYFLLKPLRVALSAPKFTGFALLITSALLFSASYKKRTLSKTNRSRMDPFLIGAAQCLALIPGISRSGSTISVARFRGWSLKEGALFSFLLSVPTILGGEILETAKLLYSSSNAIKCISLSCYAIGFIASFLVGLFSSRAVFLIYAKGVIRPFAWYCLTVGLIALILFHG